MADRIFTINLRKATLGARRWKKSKQTVAVVRKFLKKHMKSDDIKIGKSITEKIWKGGNQKIPNKIRVKVVEVEVGEEKKKVFKAELLEVVLPEGLKEQNPKEEVKKEEKKEEKPEEKKPEKKKEDKKEVKKE
jgi:large subunit ribosomal protein L31e